MCKMSTSSTSLRQRVVPAAPSPPPTVDGVEGLSAALRQVREAASTRGVTQDEFSQCIHSLTKITSPHKKTEKPMRKKNRKCCSRLYSCYKIVWILWLLFLAVCMIVIVYRPAGHLLHKLVHKHLYTVTRPLRIGIATVVPYLKAVGYDLFENDCLIPNLIISDAESCPCMYIKESTELELNQTHRAMPEGILSIPNHNVYVLRNAVEGLTNISLDIFEYYQDRLMPDMCFEMPGDGGGGVHMMTELFNASTVDKYLDEAKQPWAYNWQECPSEENPLTFHSLLPKQEWLPPSVTTSNSSYFTVSSQWAMSNHYLSTDNGERFIATLVILGDLRIRMEPSNSNCQYNCVAFKHDPILQPGDILIFDQTYWQYMATTWTRAALTSTVALTKTETMS